MALSPLWPMLVLRRLGLDLGLDLDCVPIVPVVVLVVFVAAVFVVLVDQVHRRNGQRVFPAGAQIWPYQASGGVLMIAAADTFPALQYLFPANCIQRLIGQIKTRVLTNDAVKTPTRVSDYEGRRCGDSRNQFDEWVWGWGWGRGGKKVERRR